MNKNSNPPSGGLKSNPVIRQGALKGKLADIPKQPGIYQFLGKAGEVLYVGKAKNLNSRVKQYFQKHDTRPQLPFLMAEAVDINYTVVSNELESAFLENTLIKQYSPRFNIDLKDDKNYAFIKIDYSAEIPQIGYARKIETENFKFQISNFKKNHKSRYFGPYSAVYKIRNTLNLVRKIFPYCAAEKVGARPCFYYYMHRCPGVCIGKISLNEYKLTLEKIIKFLQGNNTEITRDIKKEMILAAKAKKFETAARLRDQFKALQILQERQNVILAKKVDWDIISLANESGFSCINLFKIREGKMFDKENFVYESPATELRNKDTTNAYRVETTQRFLEQYYLETSSIPKVIYSEIDSGENELIKQIIKSRFGKAVGILTPQKGKISKLINLGKLNAEEYLKNWLNAKAGNLDKINAALAQLKDVLKLPNTPKRIECYDISNIQGTNAVASMVVFKDGLPAKSEYRKFKIRSKDTPDDFAMMKETLTRRFARSVIARSAADEAISKNKGLPHSSDVMPEADPPLADTPVRNDKTAWPLPDLIVIDGGKGQLAVAQEVLQKFQITNNKLQIPVIGLAKRIEEIFLPNKNTPIILDHDQPALQMLQRIRDAAHRFGITFHRLLRSKQAVKSALDDIPGIGPKTKKLLKTKFGTVAQIKQASLEQLTKAIGDKLAKVIKQSL